jgi:hypothetical protein
VKKSFSTVSNRHPGVAIRAHDSGGSIVCCHEQRSGHNSLGTTGENAITLTTGLLVKWRFFVIDAFTPPEFVMWIIDYSFGSPHNSSVVVKARGSQVKLCGKVSFLLATLLAVTLVAYSQSGGTYTQIDYPGAERTIIRGVNTAGELVGCYDLGDLNLHGFLYSNGTFTTIDYLPEQTTCWTGINDVGQLVGFAWMPDFFLGLSYDRRTHSITLLPPLPGARGIFAYGINNAGTIVGGAAKYNPQRSDLYYRGFVLQGTTYTILEPSPGLDVWLTSINNLGEIVGQKQDGNGVTGSFLYRDGQFAKFLIPGHPGAFANAINDNGVIAGYTNPYVGHRAFVWEKGKVTVLFFPGSAGDNVANGINNFGLVVGSFLGYDGLDHGFTWTPSDVP